MLIDSSRTDAQGVLRVMPYPVPFKNERTYGPAILQTGPLPGAGRTEAEVQATLADHQQVVESGPDSVVLSGVKIGRVAVRKDLRGSGAGRQLMDATEAWIIEALAACPAAKDKANVTARVALSAQRPAKRFYERYVRSLTQSWLYHRR